VPAGWDNVCANGLLHHKREGIATYGTVAGVFSSPKCQFWQVAAQLLIEYGAAASINSKNAVGDTPLGLAIRAGDRPTGNALLESGGRMDTSADAVGRMMQDMQRYDADKIIDGKKRGGGWASVEGAVQPDVKGGGWLVSVQQTLFSSQHSFLSNLRTCL